MQPSTSSHKNDKAIASCDHLLELREKQTVLLRRLRRILAVEQEANLLGIQREEIAAHIEGRNMPYLRLPGESFRVPVKHLGFVYAIQTKDGLTLKLKNPVP